MADEESSGYRAGETALIVTVPEAEPVVSAWRSRYDTAAAAGVPAHITVLYPFLDQQAVTAGVVEQLRALFAGPVSARIASVGLMTFTGQGWREEHRFALAGG